MVGMSDNVRPVLIGCKPLW